MCVNTCGSQRTTVGRGDQTRVIGLVAKWPERPFYVQKCDAFLDKNSKLERGVLGKLTVPAAMRADVLNTHAGLQFVAATTMGGGVACLNTFDSAVGALNVKFSSPIRWINHREIMLNQALFGTARHCLALPGWHMVVG